MALLTSPKRRSFERSLPSPHEGQVGSGYQNGPHDRAASVVTIILGLLLLVSPSSVFRLHTVGNSALMRASILALPWAWLGAIYAIPLVWLLLVGRILGLFVAIGMFSKKRTPRRT